MSHYAPWVFGTIFTGSGEPSPDGDDDTIFTGSGEPFPDWEETKKEAAR